jgi:RNA polymerase sigma-70 factor (ECF subfamily)
VIADALSGARGTTGFRARTALDKSPDQREKTQFAVARAKEGDQEAIRFLYVTYANNVYGYVRSILHDDHEAEDVTQHVFAKLLTALARYNDRGVPFFTWLLCLARNAAIDHMRKQRLTPVEHVFRPEAVSVHDLDRSETVRAALATLPPEQRQVVFLRHVMGYTPGEIAHRMGRSETSVNSLHHRGRRALQRQLKQLDAAPFTRHSHSLAA